MITPEYGSSTPSQPTDTDREFQILSLLRPKELPFPSVVEDIIDGIKEIDEEAFDESIWLDREQIHEAVMNNTGALWIAPKKFPATGTPFSPQNMIGYMMLEFRSDTSAYAAGIGVRHEWRRHHVGARLANAALWCAYMAKNVEEVTMTMRVNNTAMRAGSEQAGAKVRRHLGSDFPDKEARDELALTRKDWIASAIAQGINLESGRSLLE